MIGDGQTNSGKVMLTVKEIVVNANAVLTVNQSWILVDQEVVPTSGQCMTINGGIVYDSNGGAIKAWKAGSNKGTYVTWYTASKWTE